MAWHGPDLYQTTTFLSTSARIGASMVDLLIGDGQRGEEPDHVSVGDVDQEPLTQALVDDIAGLEREIQPDHGPENANVPEEVGHLSAQCLELLPEPRADGGRARAGPRASMVSMAASAARQAIGLPPKVEACIPGFSSSGDLLAGRS